MKELLLDLHAVHLRGWERRKNQFTVESICHAIDAGDALPPVPVVLGKYRRFGLFGEKETAYYLDMDILCSPDAERVDGGHHRAVAHWIKKKPLLCTLIAEINGPHYLHSLPIKNIQLQAKDERTLAQFLQIKRLDGRYR